MGWKHTTRGPLWAKKCFFWGVYFGGNVYLISSSILINILNGFWYKASNIILVIFQMKVFFQQNVFFNTLMFIWMKNLFKRFCEITWIKIFNYNWNGTINSYSIYVEVFHQVLQLFESFLEYIFTLQYIMTTYKLSQFFLNNLGLIKKCKFLWKLHYLVIELLYFEYNLWKPLLILARWKLKVA
jgi:hypothetical protein